MVSLMSIDTEVELSRLCRDVVARTKDQFGDEKLGEGDISLTVAEIDRGKGVGRFGDCDGETAMYPASVVKAFYLAYAAFLMDEGQLVLTDEAERACRDMIVDSSNDATGYVVDWVCGTTPGPELGSEDLAEFGRKRGAVNRWFKSHGYRGINAVQRTYNEGPYGREAQWVGAKFENRNMLTSRACAQLMVDIALNGYWSEERGAWMRSLLGRANPLDEPDKTDGQARAYTGKVIPSGTKVYSKAGWTSEVRHDMAWLVMPDGREFVIVPFTKRGKNLAMVSFMAAVVLWGLGYEAGDPLAVVEQAE